MRTKMKTIMRKCLPLAKENEYLNYENKNQQAIMEMLIKNCNKTQVFEKP